jgi:polar amino acid transport system substrate-binding protein
MKRHTFLGLAAAALLPAACDGGRGRRLVIGTDATYPPFEFTNEQGEIVGVDVDLGHEIARALGNEAEFRNINFDGLITALKSGSVDLIISSMTANDERRQSVDFSDPYVKTVLSMLIAKDSPVQNADDLRAPGRKIVARLGTTGEMWARKELPGARLVSLDSDAACVLEVVNGNVDAWVYDQVSIMNYHQRHQDTTRVFLGPLHQEFWAVALRQGEPELKAGINAALAKFRAAGGFTRLADKYLAKERDMMQAAGLPFVFEID